MHAGIADSRHRSRSLIRRLTHFGHSSTRVGQPHVGGGPAVGYGDPSDGQDYIDRSLIDFDPALGLLCGTALTRPATTTHDERDVVRSAPTVAQRAADRDAAADKVGHDPLAVRRRPSPERADIAAREEIDRLASW